MDWTLVPDPAARFENCVACQLLKWVHHEQETAGRDLELCYFRDVDRREVDLVEVEHRTPILLAECKLGEAPLDRSLRYLKARFPETDAWQVSLTGTKDYLTRGGIRAAPAIELPRRWV